MGEPLGGAVKNRFEMTPEITILDPGSLENEFASQVKQNRFIDRRGGA